MKYSKIFAQIKAGKIKHFFKVEISALQIFQTQMLTVVKREKTIAVKGGVYCFSTLVVMIKYLKRFLVVQNFS